MPPTYVTDDDTDYILNMLAHWAVTYNITNVALSALLKLLKNHKHFNSFPLDARTLLKTKVPVSTKQIQTIPLGIYYHFRIENSLKNVGKHINKNTINIVIGIDGAYH